MVGLTKTAIKKVLGRSLCSFDELRTLLTEIEACLNDRPLTYVSGDINDENPLTPSHLLIGRKLCVLPHLEFDLDDYQPNITDIVERKRYLESVLRSFWIRWKHEYLVSLRESHKKSGSSNYIVPGAIVQIREDGTSRLKWNLAIVISVHPGARSATLKTANGVTSRPVSKLYPLEVFAADVRNCVKSEERRGGVEIKERPAKRSAAVAAERRISDILGREDSEI
ncbi:uncharacterized protein LOC141906262 [Tubulanus polymorphus]|uniref:uncharacterized protein LOC141906262 n=1 Tax=Tubulanus polymorphus TaxID=672921 RepID=UPI003DA538B3